jgi:uncharacterized protein (DUF362 family)
MSQVSLIKSQHSYQGALKALQPLKQELAEKIGGLGKIAVKINLATTKNKLATTPVDSVRAFVDFVEPFYSGKIIITEESSIGNTAEGFEKYGFKRLAQENSQVEILDSAEGETEEVQIEHPGGKLILPLAKIYTQSQFLVSVCRAKTHDTVVVTLGIKNLLVGAIQGGPSNRSKIHQGKNIHWILAELAKHTYPNLVIINGVVGMEGNGPTSGTPIKSGWLVASLDPLAADSLATYLMGFDITDVGYLNLLREKGVGRLYPQDEIEIIGESPQDLITPFKPHETFENQRKWSV